MQQRLPSMLERPITFAHRGARAHAQENTLEAFSLGLRLGASGLETDAWLTADAHVVLDHDGVVRSRLRNRPIGELTRAQLPEHIPTLADLYLHCGTEFELSIDLKSPDVGRHVVEVTDSIDPSMLARLWLCAPQWQLLLDLRGHGAKLVDSTRLARIKEGPERRAATLANEGIDAVNMHYTDWNGGLVALFHRFERYALGWDMQHDDVLRPALRMGLDGVYSDFVDRMCDSYRAEIGAF